MLVNTRFSGALVDGVDLQLEGLSREKNRLYQLSSARISISAMLPFGGSPGALGLSRLPFVCSSTTAAVCITVVAVIYMREGEISYALHRMEAIAVVVEYDYETVFQKMKLILLQF